MTLPVADQLPSSSWWKSSRSCRGAIGTAAVGICLVRAATQSISHDEARSFLLFVQGPWRHAFASTGANHILLVMMSRVLVRVLPVSELTLRPPVVAGAAVYGVATAWLLRRFIADPWLRTAGLALMTLNPYALDFFSVARGYGVMLACLLAAMCVLIPTTDEGLTRGRASGTTLAVPRAPRAF